MKARPSSAVTRDTSKNAEHGVAPGAPPHADMVWIPGGTFRMGSEDFYPEERPVHEVPMDGFWMETA